MSILVPLVVACGEQSSEGESAETDAPQNQQNALITEPETGEETLIQADAQEELLAENLEESESPYVETELHEVVLTRKVPGDKSNQGTAETSGSEEYPRLDRLIVNEVTLVNPTQEEGLVSVEVVVDPTGKVLNARVMKSNYRTNTSNTRLHEAAIAYAKKLRFESGGAFNVTSVQVVDVQFTVN